MPPFPISVTDYLIKLPRSCQGTFTFSRVLRGAVCSTGRTYLSIYAPNNAPISGRHHHQGSAPFTAVACGCDLLGVRYSDVATGGLNAVCVRICIEHVFACLSPTCKCVGYSGSIGHTR